jgi:mono/diheme cytochrome c family protein
MIKLTLQVCMMGAALLLISSCASARRSEALTGPIHFANQDQARGQQVFFQHCHQCHPGGEAGLGPALNNKPLPAFLIRTQVRQGFGAMPAFSKEEISQDEMAVLLDYLKVLRRHGS